ncbi:MAG: VirB8/TrbF family protein, partial [Candidatus Poribacteria bacterium]
MRLINPANSLPLFWSSPTSISIVINSAGSPDITDGSHETALRGDIERAALLEQRAVDAYRSIDDVEAVAGGLNRLGNLLQRAGDAPGAHRAYLEAAALALAMPLKQIEPIAVLVDRTTGNVERVDLDQPRALLANQALQQSLLAQYVTAREGFDPVGIRAAYRKVALWSSGQARASYLEQMRHNP